MNKNEQCANIYNDVVELAKANKIDTIVRMGKVKDRDVMRIGFDQEERLESDPVGRRVEISMREDSYCQHNVVFVSETTQDISGIKAPATKTRHYHDENKLRFRVIDNNLKATPTDRFVQQLVGDVVHFLTFGITPEGVKL